ncbi:MAG: TolC family protein [Bryobacterales bacterium]|nr:TolC family protein [Bryobacterales bacterium]
MRTALLPLLAGLLSIAGMGTSQDAASRPPPPAKQPAMPTAAAPIDPTEFRRPSGVPPQDAPSYLLPPQPPRQLPRYGNQWLPAPASAGVADPASLSMLRLDDVLASVQATYPLLTIAELDRTIAQAAYLMAQGNFDLKVKAGTSVNELGFYESRRFDAGFEQDTTLWGATFFGGYAISDGSFPSYAGGLQTQRDGEFKAGFLLPLLRGRPIDERRAELRGTDLGRSLANFNIDEQKVTFVLAASQTYWAWVAAGQRYAYAKELLEIATLRDSILREAATLGSIPQIEVTDNQRAILQRQSTVLSAERSLQKASISLSLFLRDSSGNPFIPRADQLPREFPPPAPMGLERIEEATADAFRRRPELEFLATQRAQVEVDAALARNDRNPNLDLEFTFARGLGDRPGTSVFRGPEELKAGLFFNLPVQRRKATGKLQAAEAKIGQVRAKEQFQRDKIAADVRDSLLAVEMAYQRVNLLQQEVAVARQLQVLEKDRFDLGDSTLFLVNLREQATFDAEVRAVSATEDYFRSFADYQAATAEALSGNPLSMP